MGLLDIIPVVVGAGVTLKIMDVALAKRDVQSIHDRAKKKSKKVV